MTSTCVFIATTICFCCFFPLMTQMFIVISTDREHSKHTLLVVKEVWIKIKIHLHFHLPSSMNYIRWIPSDIDLNCIVCNVHMHIFLSRVIVDSQIINCQARVPDLHTKWSNIYERNSKLIVNFKKGPELML